MKTGLVISLIFVVFFTQLSFASGKVEFSACNMETYHDHIIAAGTITTIAPKPVQNVSDGARYYKCADLFSTTENKSEVGQALDKHADCLKAIREVSSLLKSDKFQKIHSGLLLRPRTRPLRS